MKARTPQRPSAPDPLAALREQVAAASRALARLRVEKAALDQERTTVLGDRAGKGQQSALARIDAELRRVSAKVAVCKIGLARRKARLAEANLSHA